MKIKTNKWNKLYQLYTEFSEEELREVFKDNDTNVETLLKILLRNIKHYEHDIENILMVNKEKSHMQSGYPDPFEFGIYGKREQAMGCTQYELIMKLMTCPCKSK
jgi:hypothetical protein